MDSHITGPYNVGYGAQLTQRAKIINFDTPTGEYELGTIQASADKPVLAEAFLHSLVASDGVGTSIALNFKGAGVPVALSSMPVNPFVLLEENTRVYVTFTEGTGATTGRWVASIRAAGFGELPVSL